jgi:glucan biosynthesis protein C
MNASRERIVYIDLIKVFLTCLVVVHHAGQAYGKTGGVWLVSEDTQLDYLPTLFFFNASFMMGFYFFISGYFIFSSLQRKSKIDFLQERLIKFGIPLIFFSLVIFTPLHFFLSKQEISFLDFSYDLYFNKPPLSFGHLWFVALLLVFSLLFILLKDLFKKTSSESSLKIWHPLIFLFLLIPINVFVRHYYPIDKWVTWIVPLEVAHLPQYLSLFVLGAIFNSKNWMENIKASIGLLYFFGALLVFLNKNLIQNQVSGLWGASLIESIVCVGLCLGLIVLFKNFGKKMNFLPKTLSENSYGIYLFHLLIVIFLQVLLKNLELNLNLKFFLVSVFGIFLPWLLTYFLRKNSLIRKVL